MGKSEIPRIIVDFKHKGSKRVERPKLWWIYVVVEYMRNWVSKDGGWSLATGIQGLLWTIVLLVVVVVVVVIVVVVVVVFIIIIVVVTIIISEVPLPSRKSNRSSYISFRKYSSGDYLLYNTLSTYNFSALRPLLTDF